MLIEINQTFCTCQKCGHTWTPKVKREDAPKEIVFLQPITTIPIVKKVRKCPACDARRFDLAEDGRSIDKEKLEVDKLIDL